jgi:hypothetical protein
MAMLSFAACLCLLGEITPFPRDFQPTERDVIECRQVRPTYDLMGVEFRFWDN